MRYTVDQIRNFTDKELLDDVKFKLFFYAVIQPRLSAQDNGMDAHDVMIARGGSKLANKQLEIEQLPLPKAEKDYRSVMEENIYT